MTHLGQTTRQALRPPTRPPAHPRIGRCGPWTTSTHQASPQRPECWHPSAIMNGSRSRATGRCAGRSCTTELRAIMSRTLDRVKINDHRATYALAPNVTRPNPLTRAYAHPRAALRVSCIARICANAHACTYMREGKISGRHNFRSIINTIVEDQHWSRSSCYRRYHQDQHLDPLYQDQQGMINILARACLVYFIYARGPANRTQIHVCK